jgi:hypothetical protein
MAVAKLSGSLLESKNVPQTATLAQHASAPSDATVSGELVNCFESAGSASCASGRTDGPVVAQGTAAAGQSNSVSRTNTEHYRFGRSIRLLAICGVAATTAVGIVLYMHATGYSGPKIASQPNPASPSVSNSALANSAPKHAEETKAAVTDATTPANLARVELPEQPTMTDASETSALVELPTEPKTAAAPAIPGAGPKPPLTAMAAPTTPLPKPVTDAPAPAWVAEARLSKEEASATDAAAPISSLPQSVSPGDAPGPAAQATGANLPGEEVAALVVRGDALLGIGDVVSARLCYERAAEERDALAALRLGETYDSAFLVHAHVNGVRGDATVAARWYQRARELGAGDAEILLSSVAANDDAAKRSKKLNQLFEQFLARQGGQTR